MFIFSNEARPAHSVKPKRVSAGEQLWLAPKGSGGSLQRVRIGFDGLEQEVPSSNLERVECASPPRQSSRRRRL